MTICEKIDQLVFELMTRREPISPVVVLGTVAFRQLLKEFGGYQLDLTRQIIYQHGLGPMKLRHSELVEETSISINGRTVDDIIAEEILLAGADET